MKGNDIVLSIDGTAIAAATNASIELSQEAEEYTPMPGSTDDDGWRHYRPGHLSWNVSHDGLVTEDAEDLLSAIYSDDDDITLTLTMGTNHSLTGTAKLSEVGIVAQVRTLAKMSAKFNCNDFPTLV